MEFLKYFITEDIYLLPDNRVTKQEEQKTSIPAEAVKAGGTEKNEEPVKEVTDKSYPLTVISAQLNEEEEKLLSAILKAVNVNLSDIALLEKENDRIQSKKVLIFGNTYFEQLPLYKVSSHDEKRFLKSDDLAAVSSDVEKKRKLWTSLQEMFSV